MSESESVSAIDTKQIIQNIDYDELFDGTALEGIEPEDGDIIEAIGERIGEILGRQIGEVVGGYLGALLVGNLSESSESDAAEEGDAEADSDEQPSEGDDGNKDGSE